MVSRSIDLSGQWLIFLPFLSGFAACRFSVFGVRWLFSLFFALQLLRLRKRARTLTRGHYLGLKNTRDYGSHGDHRCDRGDFHGDHRGDHRGDFCGDHRGDRGRYRGGSGRGDYSNRRSPRRSPYRGGHDHSPQHSPYVGRYRKERSRSIPQSPYSPDRRYAGGSR
ncbi:hypothetical protein P8452_75603 [Trifolium repens]|nr:hypothetical protein P8452_75603 [Trifolium repens]